MSQTLTFKTITKTNVKDLVDRLAMFGLEANVQVNDNTLQQLLFKKGDEVVFKIDRGWSGSEFCIPEIEMEDAYLIKCDIWKGLVPVNKTVSTESEADEVKKILLDKDPDATVTITKFSRPKKVIN
jgi:hypothetical protein